VIRVPWLEEGRDSVRPSRNVRLFRLVGGVAWLLHGACVDGNRQKSVPPTWLPIAIPPRCFGKNIKTWGLGCSGVLRISFYRAYKLFILISLLGAQHRLRD